MDNELYDFSDIPHEESGLEKVQTFLLAMLVCAFVGLFVGLFIALFFINPFFQV